MRHRPFAAAVLVVLCAGCGKPTPLEVHCDPPRRQAASCHIETEPGATSQFVLGEQSTAEFLVPATGVSELEVDWAQLSFDVKSVRFIAKGRSSRPAEVDWPLPALRYHVQVSPAGAVRFELPAGASVVWAGAPLVAGSDGIATVAIDLIADLPLESLTGDSSRELPFTIRAADGATLDDVIEVWPPDGATEALAASLRARGTPLPFAAALTAAPRPGVLVTTSSLAPIGGLVKLGDAQIVVFAEDQDEDQLEMCGLYEVNGVPTTVIRWRSRRDVEAFEARTGRSLGKKTLRGSTPRGCRDYEMVGKIEASLLPGQINGSPIDEAAIGAWVASLP